MYKRQVCELCEAGEKLSVCIEIRIHSVLICRSSTELTVSRAVLPSYAPEPTRNGYYVHFAVGDTDARKLYGREDEKEEIKYAIETGKAVIYGPSRIGKTSLMN